MLLHHDHHPFLPRSNKQPHNFHRPISCRICAAVRIPERHCKIARAKKDAFACIITQRSSTYSQSNGHVTSTCSPHAYDKRQDAGEGTSGGIQKDGKQTKEECTVAGVVEHGQIQHLHEVVDNKAPQYGL